jgi:hypothetical protein
MPEQPKNLGAAIFLNAAILPGAGHWLAGYTRHAAAMIAAIILLLFAPLFRFMFAVMQLVQESIVETGRPMRTLEVLAAAWRADRTLYLLCIAGIVLIWIYGIVDLARRRSRHP